MNNRTKKMKTFLICPVRGHDPAETAAIVAELEGQGYQVHWPPRDTVQDDDTGYRICRDNRDAIEEADVVHVVWDGVSQGCLFDLGMAFAMDKRVIPIHLPEPTGGKSFQNMVRAWVVEGDVCDGRCLDFRQQDGDCHTERPGDPEGWCRSCRIKYRNLLVKPTEEELRARQEAFARDRAWAGSTAGHAALEGGLERVARYNERRGKEAETQGVVASPDRVSDTVRAHLKDPSVDYVSVIREEARENARKTIEEIGQHTKERRWKP